jgi:hypothetical protein
MSRLADVIRFYQLIAALEDKLGGKRTLSVSSSRLDCPRRGVYFFSSRAKSVAIPVKARGSSASAPTQLQPVRNRNCGGAFPSIVAP